MPPRSRAAAAACWKFRIFHIHWPCRRRQAQYDRPSLSRILPGVELPREVFEAAERFVERVAGSIVGVSGFHRDHPKLPAVVPVPPRRPTSQFPRHSSSPAPFRGCSFAAGIGRRLPALPCREARASASPARLNLLGRPSHHVAMRASLAAGRLAGDSTPGRSQESRPASRRAEWTARHIQR